jgi:hypothetical protein
MRTIAFLAVVFLMAPSAAIAQNASSGGGTSPQNRGSTGWTGAHPETGGATLDQNKPKGQPGSPIDATTGQSVTVHDESEARSQPPIATGEDLKGAPRQLAPSKTPE